MPSREQCSASSAGFAGAIGTGGRLRKGGGAPPPSSLARVREDGRVEGQGRIARVADPVLFPGPELEALRLDDDIRIGHGADGPLLGALDGAENGEAPSRGVDGGVEELG